MTRITDIESPLAVGDSRRDIEAQIDSLLKEMPERGSQRAAAIVLEVEAAYVGRARDRVPSILAAWQRRRSERILFARISDSRFAVLVAPVASAQQGRRMAEELARSADPRLCPLLRRALPYAHTGVSSFPDDAIDAAGLLAHAEAALERARTAARQPRRALTRRRLRLAASARLQPT